MSRALARDATSGRTVSKAVAKANPTGTTTETIQDLDEQLARLVLKYKRAKLPTKITGDTADDYYRLKLRASLVNKLVDSVDKDRKALKQHIIQNLPKSQTSGVAGRLARIKIESQKKPILEDVTKFRAYVKKTGDFDLMTRAINTAAIEERWDAKKKIPGIGTFDYKTISVNKL